MPLATTMLQSWLDRLPAQRDEIQAALESGDFETLRQRAHAIKGAAANLSAMPLSRAAAELEQAARRADAPACRNLIPAFADLCHQLAVYVVQKSPPNPKEPSP